MWAEAGHHDRRGHDVTLNVASQPVTQHSMQRLLDNTVSEKAAYMCAWRHMYVPLFTRLKLVNEPLVGS
jgi:hypothetical protein